MCGIVAILRRLERHAAFPDQEVEASLVSAALALGRLISSTAPSAGVDEANGRGAVGVLQGQGIAEILDAAAASLIAADEQFRRPVGVQALLKDGALRLRVEECAGRAGEKLVEFESWLDRSGSADADVLERINAALIRCKDATWSLQRDRLGTVEAMHGLLPKQHIAAVTAVLSIQQALAALDRLEVRGRDSAGLHLLLTGHGIDEHSVEARSLLHERAADPLFRNLSVRFRDGNLSLVYKTAAEIGELGDNGRVLRRCLAEDPLLRRALGSELIEVAVLAHTRWASVGIISEANAHPLNEEVVEGRAWPGVVAVLNGDVDNYADLKANEGLRFAPEITSDAKVIPAMMGWRMAEGRSLEAAFVETVSSFVGSVAIAAASNTDPDRLLLALRGSGQGIYVGISPATYFVASEPYGLVEETPTYLRLDGDAANNRENPQASRGQVVVLDRGLAGSLDGIRRCAYDGTPLPVDSKELQQAAITTRDIDRGSFPHFLLKEITESPLSFHKTLRGRVVEVHGRLGVALGSGVLTPELRRRIVGGMVRRILVIGQGTAAVAGRAVALAIEQSLQSAHVNCEVRAETASELSGFGLADDMGDTLIVAISQSGTTTDTNRTVDVVKARGAHVLAIVNRRHSDLTSKADGVLYTSDGRDVEMSVASTKAFYAQVAAGFVLALALADLWRPGTIDSPEAQGILRGLHDLPTAMRRVIESAPEIARIAAAHAPRLRHWALVGNGPNLIAAEEIRIKLSELCYKSIACDATEDKKHIDLSSEPLILVCCAGLSGSNADDVAKEVAIYRAHKATPIVIASEGDQRFQAATALITVPRTHPRLDFVLSALAGHLFGYHAARAIDSRAVPLREIRAAIERLASETTSRDSVSGAPLSIGNEPEFSGVALDQAESEQLMKELRECTRSARERFATWLREREYDGHLEPSTAVELALLLRVVEGAIPLDAYTVVRGRTAGPATVIEDLNEALTRGIGELTRPIDAIKHQAKTVTVGISRSDEALLHVPLVAELLRCGADRDRVSYADLRTLGALDPVVERVLGFAHYRIDGDPGDDDCGLVVLQLGGVARGIGSSASRRPRLLGTKRGVALERRMLLARGRRDGRLFVVVPEVSANLARGLMLLHLQLKDAAGPAVLRGVLAGYRNRYAQLRDAVMETEPSFREDLLAALTVEELLLEPIGRLAERWRGGGGIGGGG